MQHLDRKPANLSGGQRQRVAMGRAIVRDPNAFLMDEPLSNLDAKLRVQMRTAVAKLQSDLGTTTVYVTHDQTEAMTLGDRVAVMRSGVLQQVGAPAELYDTPTNIFVAGFIGSPAMNFLPGEIEGDRVKLPIGDLPLPEQARGGAGGGASSVIVGIRAGGLRGRLAGSATGVSAGPSSRRRSTWSSRWARRRTPTSRSPTRASSRRSSPSSPRTPASPRRRSGDQGMVVARIDAESKISRGEEAELWVDATKLHLFDPESGQRLGD